MSCLERNVLWAFACLTCLTIWAIAQSVFNIKSQTLVGDIIEYIQNFLSPQNYVYGIVEATQELANILCLETSGIISN